jgi:hypothetical protein
MEGDMQEIEDLIIIGGQSVLEKPDGLGNMPLHTAIMYDRIEVIRLFGARGMNLSKPCDSVRFGTPAFFAQHYGKTAILTLLWELGIDLGAKCDKWGFPPLYYCGLRGDTFTADHIKEVMSRGTLGDVKQRIIACAFYTYSARLIYKQLKAEREQMTYVQVLIAAPWRGGVVRMRMNRAEKARDKEKGVKEESSEEEEEEEEKD